MEEAPKYVVGIDIGTENVRGVMAAVGEKELFVVGYAEAENNGMRKGEIVNLNGPANAVDSVLYEMEKMSGGKIDSVVASVNGQYVQSADIYGLVTFGDRMHKIEPADLARVESTAMDGQNFANKEILDVIPREYIVDGQGGVREPLGMVGMKLELNANTISSMAVSVDNVRKTLEQVVGVHVQKVMPSGIAAAQAVLTEKQMEYGIAMIDFGATTTNVLVYTDGVLEALFVIPMGSEDLTRELARKLMVDMETAEKIKRRFISGSFDDDNAEISIKKDGIVTTFDRETIDSCTEEIMVEIFTKVKKGLIDYGQDHGLPEGVVLVGGGAKLRNIEVLVREILEMSVRIGKPIGLAGSSEAVAKPEYSAAVGLMLMASEDFSFDSNYPACKKEKSKVKKPGLLANLLKKF